MPRLLMILIPALFLFALLALACEDRGTPSSGGEEAATAAATLSLGEEASPTVIAAPRILTATTDASAFLQRFQEDDIIEEKCDYDAQNVLAFCGNRGTFALTPAPRGEEVICDLLIVEREPIAVTCTGQEPLQTIYYPMTDP